MARPEDGHAAHEASDGGDDAGYAEVVETVCVQPSILSVCERHGGEDRCTVRHCGWTSVGTWGHTGDPVAGLSMIEDAVLYGNPGTSTQKTTGVERPSGALDGRAQPGTCRLNEDKRGERRGYGPALHVGPASKSTVNDHEIVPGVCSWLIKR